MSSPSASMSGAELALVMDRLRRSPGGRAALVELLPEHLPVYAGRSAAEMVRLRGYLLAALCSTGLPDEALPFVLESLQTGDQPYEVAGAAIGLRGHPGPPPHVLMSLVTALHNLTGADATVSFESYDPPWPYLRPTTAIVEVVRTIGHFGARAASARAELELLATHRGRYSAMVLAEMERVLAQPLPRAPEPAPAVVPDRVSIVLELRRPTDLVLLEDQDGLRTSFDDAFAGKAAVVAFFYTRCDNPYKCTLTVTRLAAMQQKLARRGLGEAVRLAAITYDPDFDLPARLGRYGTDRGFRFGPDARFYRTVSGFSQLREGFRLGVNHGPATVNRHQVEVYVLDPAGAVQAAFTRVQWDVDEVLDMAIGLLPAAYSRDPAASIS